MDHAAAGQEGGRGSQPGSSAASSDRALRGAVLTLMGARLGLSLVSLALAVGLEAAGAEHFTTTEWQGFYATVALAFLATLCYGLVQRRVRQWRRFAGVNVATDVAIVSALVHFSGGSDSAFAFRLQPCPLG